MKRTLLFSALMAACHSHADIAVETIYSFPGQMQFMTATEQGLAPAKPPVYISDSNTLFGVTTVGGGALPITDPRMAGLALMPSAFYTFEFDAAESGYNGHENPLFDPTARPSATPAFQTGVAADSLGNVYGGSASTLFKWNATDGLVDVLADQETSAFNGGEFTVTGLLVTDNNNNVYFGITNASDDYYALMKLSSEGELTQVVDFARGDYVQGVESDAVYLKGNSPAAIIFSSVGQALYGLGHLAENVGGAGDPAALADGDSAAGTVFKINLADIAEDGSTPIEVLATFSNQNNGAIDDHIFETHSLTESGDWLYGNSSKGVWRLSKQTAATLEMLHVFGEGQNSIATEDDGSDPHGPVVIAADGNLYGTAAGKGSDAQSGVIYRVNISADTVNDAQRADDQFEILADFTESASKVPAGLSLGQTTTDAQTVYGITQGASSADDTGSVFRFNVQPQSLALSVNNVEIEQGESVELSWQATNLTGCQAGGSWTGDKDATATETVTLTDAGDANLTLTCVNADNKVFSQQVMVAVAAKAEPDPEPTPTPTPDPEPTPDAEPSSGGGSSSSGGALFWLTGLLGLVAARRKFTKK